MPGAPVSQEQLSQWIAERLADELQIPLEKIDPKSSFARYGLDSIRAVGLVADLEDYLQRRLDITVLWEHPTIEGLSRHLLGSGAQSAQPAAPATSALSGQGSGMQQAISLLMKRYEGTYLIGRAVKLIGNLQLDALRAAMNDVVARHPMLRTSLTVEGEAVRWQEHPTAELPCPVEDGSGWSEAQLDARLVELTSTPIDPKVAPMARAQLIRRSDSEHVLVLCIDHRVFDAWSLFLFFLDLLVFFPAREKGGRAELPPVPVRYAHFIEAEQQTLAKNGGELRSFWRKELEGRALSIPLPASRAATEEDGLFVRPRFVRFDRPTSDKVRQLAQSQDATVFQVLLSAWSTLLRFRTGAQQFPITSSVDVRRPEHRETVGPFLNHVVFMLDISGDPTATEHIQRVRRAVLDGLSHDTFPFGSVLLSGVGDWKDRIRMPLIQVHCNFYNFAGLAETSSRFDSPLVARPLAPFSLGSLRAEPITISKRKAPFDLSLWITFDDGELVCRLEGCADRFEEQRVHQLLEQFSAVVRAMTDRPQQRLAELAAVIG